MSLISAGVNVVGLLLLGHAYVFLGSFLLCANLGSVYSAWEHGTLHKTALPIDITLETIASVLVICVGVVLGSPSLKPIEWHIWANNVEQREGKRSKGTLVETKEEAGVGVDPFRILDERPGFVDIRVSFFR